MMAINYNRSCVVGTFITKKRCKEADIGFKLMMVWKMTGEDWSFIMIKRGREKRN